MSVIYKSISVIYKSMSVIYKSKNVIFKSCKKILWIPGLKNIIIKLLIEQWRMINVIEDCYFW